MKDLTDDADFWDRLAPFDTAKDSPLRDANPELWAVIYGAQMIGCIPIDEMENDAGLRRWVFQYVRTVARSVTKLFNPDGTLRNLK